MNKSLFVSQVGLVEEPGYDNQHLVKKILNTREAARFLDLSPSSLYKLTSQKLIPFYRPNGKRIFFLRSELESWLLKTRIVKEVLEPDFVTQKTWQ